MPSARVASSRSQFDPVRLARPIASSAHWRALAVSPRADGEQRAAALVHRPQEQRAVRGFRPLVEETGGRVPAAGPQLELATCRRWNA